MKWRATALAWAWGVMLVMWGLLYWPVIVRWVYGIE